MEPRTSKHSSVHKSPYMCNPGAKDNKAQPQKMDSRRFHQKFSMCMHATDHTWMVTSYFNFHINSNMG